MRRLLQLAGIALVAWAIAFWHALPVLAQDPSASANGLPALSFGQWMVVLSNFGIGGIVFIVWFFDMKRQTALEQLIERYDQAQAGHLQAFRDISAAYRELAAETNKATLLNVQIQTRLVEKLERMEREAEKP